MKKNIIPTKEIINLLSFVFVFFFVGITYAAIPKNRINISLHLHNYKKVKKSYHRTMTLHNLEILSKKRVSLNAYHREISTKERQLQLKQAQKAFCRGDILIAQKHFFQSGDPNKLRQLINFAGYYWRGRKYFYEHYYKSALNSLLKARLLNHLLSDGKSLFTSSILSMLAKIYNVKGRIAIFDRYYVLAGIYFAEARYYGSTLQEQKSYNRILRKIAKLYYQKGLESHLLGLEGAKKYFENILQMLPPSEDLYIQSKKILINLNH